MKYGEYRWFPSHTMPYDKSRAQRRTFLDAMNGKWDTIDLVEGKMAAGEEVGDDIRFGYHASIDWLCGAPINVGESRTTHSFYKFASMKLGQDREFVLYGTLAGRELFDDPEIVNYTMDQLIQLKTSQMASAAAMMGNIQRPTLPIPNKLQVTYDTMREWASHQRRQDAEGEKIYWPLEKDSTIEGQMRAFVDYMMIKVSGNEGAKMRYKVTHSEDVPFGIAFGLIDPEEAAEAYPNSRYHESDRIAEVPREIQRARDTGWIESKDHRPIYSVALLMLSEGTEVKIRHEGALRKSFPGFKAFYEYAATLAKK